ncbi:sulfate adenylyltransferase subunit 1 [Auraticoccus monumenti]|uniref:sulfate adenylyltransferase n=1 Tax=Auraticoccus monumenti TaxID=675864 RepID=A0A1G6ZCG1_9ACTN|nr:GTP-binding protein [Auraticoccus monumenti]SDE00328.1 sulfate adenylyltransferase subunit 1 [Auraticoccus monumenti]
MTTRTTDAEVLGPDQHASSADLSALSEGDARLVDPEANRDLLRLATAGSVDDGKSTLVGRLLYDTKSVLADQLAAVERVSRERGLQHPDLALLTDGLRAEREQGITIDVAYRYFSTPGRSYILADTPGHVQYTRNMVTGASTAELALILVDARHGVLEQTRRHLAVTGLLGLRHVALVVNKMDLVDFDQQVFDAIVADFTAMAGHVGISAVTAVPISALMGDNVVTRSVHTPWYDGPTLLQHLETVDVTVDPSDEAFRMPVQYVIRPQTPEHPDYRGYAGRITSGVVSVGDRIQVQPEGFSSTVVGIDRVGRPGEPTEHQRAHAPQSVVLRLADDLDIARGDLLATAERPATEVKDLDATVAVLSSKPLRVRDMVLVRVGTATVKGLVTDLVDTLDMTTLERGPAPAELPLNGIGGIRVRLARPVAVDDYAAARRTGSFLLVDPVDGSTLAAGLITLTGDLVDADSWLI